ncbi:hypothetical protein KXD40_009458 [Peronospora effusa]|uniref:Uncharacterized protein n=1 Tax=Peronospora effusa TaxID=542832 RepID=A0A3M6VBC9_9STRA|nr:hypothetical protein DD238_007590 [Peronospora effusa]RQM13318.1 hypothetical protein DD237_007270 [Peronospora effusa]UIZ28534.1 hypothetical protein KXD40_009458 [Peronospora effusa]
MLGSTFCVLKDDTAKRDTRDTKFRAVTRFVAQEDSLFNRSFTVLETMRMNPKLSLPITVTSNEIESRIDDVMEAMGLGTLWWTTFFCKGLSGVHKR